MSTNRVSTPQKGASTPAFWKAYGIGHVNWTVEDSDGRTVAEHLSKGTAQLLASSLSALSLLMEITHDIPDDERADEANRWARSVVSMAKGEVSR